MVFNWKRGPNPLTAKEDEEEATKEMAEALPIDLEQEEAVAEPPAAAARPILEEAVRAPEPALKPAPKPEPKPEPKFEAKNPRRNAKSAPPVSPFPAGRSEAPAAPPAPPVTVAGVEALRDRFQATQRAFQQRLEEEVREMNAAFEQSLTDMSDRVKSLSEQVTEREARLANQDAEITRLRSALRKVVAEASDVVNEAE